MYTARYINPLKQFGKLNTELILTDPEGVLPDVRQWTKFPDTTTDQKMLTQAENIAKSFVKELKQKQDVSAEISQIDEEQIAFASIKLDKPIKGTETVTKD